MLRKTLLLAALFAVCSCNTSPTQELRRAGAAVLVIPDEPTGPGATTFVVCEYGDDECPRKYSVPVGEVVLGSYQRDDGVALSAPAFIEAMLWSVSVPSAPRRWSQGEGGR